MWQLTWPRSKIETQRDRLRHNLGSSGLSACEGRRVSGRRIAIAPRTEGNQRSQTNRKRLWSLRYLPAKHVELLAKDQYFCRELRSRLKKGRTMWRISRSNSIIRWQDYRVSASRLAESNFRYPQGQDRLKRSLMNSGSHPEAVLESGSVARCSTTTRRSTSPFK
jgi:hypothetical protein